MTKDSSHSNHCRRFALEEGMEAQEGFLFWALGNYLSGYTWIYVIHVELYSYHEYTYCSDIIDH